MKAIRRVLQFFRSPTVLTATAAALCLMQISIAASASIECDRLQRAIADSSRSGQGAQFQAAADRQRVEIDRTVAYSKQIGCGNRKFLFFGSDPPAQCDQIRGQIDRMRSNLQDLESKAGGGPGGRGEMISRYSALCGNQPSHPPSIVDALFGQPKSSELQEQPLSPEGGDPEKQVEKLGNSTGEARAGGKAVCVRSCDGAFFPLSYSAAGGALDNLAEMCRALCPNAEVTLYTYPVSGEIEQAVSINGTRYVDSPTALRYRHVFDPSCSCRRRGQTWTNALAPAESLLGREDKSDIIVTPEKAAELSRPKADLLGEPKLKGTKNTKGSVMTPSPPVAAVTSPSTTPLFTESGKTDANGVDMTLRDATATIGHESSGIGGAADSLSSGPVGEDQGKTFDEVGPDGAKRKVRVIGD